MNKTSLAQIINESARLFAQKGYFGTSVDDIAQAVGVRKSSLYHHIRSKSSVLQWIVTDAMKRHIESLKPILEDKESSFTEKIRAAIRTHLELGVAHSNEVIVLLHGFRALDPHLQRPLVAQMREYGDGIAGLIQGGIEAGEFRPVDPQLTSFDILGRCNWVFRWYHPEGRLTIGEIAAGLSDLTLHGIATGKRD